MRTSAGTQHGNANKRGKRREDNRLPIGLCYFCPLNTTDPSYFHINHHRYLRVHSSMAFASESNLFSAVGINSCATWPVNPVPCIACIIAG